VGSVMFAQKDPSSSQWIYPRLELVRLAIPRRVYTQTHLDYVADTVIEVFQNRSAIRGMRYTYEPELLRHFSARFEFV
jgi:tyrosine phenol-lyase